MKLTSEKIKKIAVFRALQLGDLLCSIPAIRALRTAYPHAQISLIGLPWATSLVQRFSGYFDTFIHFPGYPGLPEQQADPAAVTTFLTEMQREQFDLVLQMQGNGTIVNPMVVLIGGRHTSGFCIPNDYCPDPHLFLQYPDGISETERHLKLMDLLEIPSQGTHLEFPLTTADEDDYVKCNLRVEKNRYICIHPGSRGSWRQWPVEYFAALGDYCIEQELPVVLTGTSDELIIVNKVMEIMKHQAINAAGKTSLGAVGVLIKNAFGLISNCTGVSHMASAFQTPSVVISMDGEPERWAPLNRQLHRTIDWTKTPDYELVFKETMAMVSGRESSIRE